MECGGLRVHTPGTCGPRVDTADHPTPTRLLKTEQEEGSPTSAFAGLTPDSTSSCAAQCAEQLRASPKVIPQVWPQKMQETPL